MGEPAARQGQRQGDFLGGKYLLGDCLGIGGMGEVYRATNVSLGRNVAVKILNKEHTANEDDVLRFLREARAAAAVRHPNVVDVLDVARDDDGTPFIVQELLSGEDLEQYIIGGGRGRIGVEEALEIIIPVAEAVAAAHARDVVHRDMKPANIFLSKEGSRIVPKVLDFGACLYQTVGGVSAKERRMLIGTPHYMAPEQVSLSAEVDAAADVWALGVILYELVGGETPFEADDVNQVLKLVRTGPIPKLRELAPRAPASLEALVARCLDRDPKKRYRNASALKDALEGVRQEVKGAARARVETMPDGEQPANASVPSLELRAARTPTVRRKASLLTLSGPGDDPMWGDDDAGAPGKKPPASASRPIEAARPPPVPTREAPRPAGRGAPPAKPPVPTAAKAKPAAPSAMEDPRTARFEAEIEDPNTARFEPQEASLELEAPTPSRPPARGPSSPVPAAPASARPSASASAEDDHNSLHLDFEPPSSSRRGVDIAAGKPPSSLPPVLDPRAASGSRMSERPSATAAGAATKTAESARALRVPTPGQAPTSAMRSRPSVASSDEGRPAAPWSTRSTATFVAAITVPALVAFVVLAYATSVLGPLGQAMRGDTPLSSGVLAVITLIGAGALVARALTSRARGILVAAVSAVVLGVVMIIVTFSASETAELGVPPAVAGIVPFIAPIVPLSLGVVALQRAREVWLSTYERREAITFTALTSLMVLAALELGPIGAVRTAPSAIPSPASPASSVAPSTPNSPAP